ncbi:hypothetical protein NEOLI_000499 [Neolecta irregularis DAH-3]|uniref:Uncharacterized protein n=1 Tax=Neolecta irregularis (strain DAH-3) TaxID=1198029 RepID=A0A1U7LU73_NEOID|nr:hypothetical protein NEOLI_000499 [Neolecta irregularis DAH-3]|eukprot:OLL26092.1 hypothetical protein NEOLI_000499 [Neolecta irregularis DAH-3]
MNPPFILKGIPAFQGLERFFAMPSKIRTPAFSLRVRFRDPSDKNPVRVLVVASKKQISNSAVVRNRVRRRIMEAVRVSLRETNLSFVFGVPSIFVPLVDPQKTLHVIFSSSRSLKCIPWSGLLCFTMSEMQSSRRRRKIPTSQDV